ncbi:MAG: Acetolactate synthase/2/3 large subunit, partial [Actinomycetia bacterium]|nr:Acetolactate synthase/2/3 large subunit [Actinomycetes bacterium]
RKTLAVVSDLHPELVSAVHWHAPAIWLVLNEAEKPARIDYAQLARAVGAAALTVETECHLPEALTAALNSPTPFVLDVLVRRS